MKKFKELPIGKKLLYLSLATRISVLLLISFFAAMNIFLNYKSGYNSARLVSLSSGPLAGGLYWMMDGFLSLFGNSATILQSSGGMTWSIRIFGFPFTDPVAAMSFFIKNRSFETGFFLGLAVPVTLAAVFGRVFCSYICPASLLFFFTSRIRRLIEPYFFLPRISLSSGFAWGMLFGGLLTAYFFGHGIWTLILPYFAMGQVIFHGIAFGTISAVMLSIIFYALLDLFLGQQFTCRYVCPTGRLLGFIGKRAFVSVRRDPASCLPKCNSCAEVCPMGVSPRMDETVNCTLCGECMVICPGNCLKPGQRDTTKNISDRILKELITFKQKTQNTLKETAEEK